MQKKVIIIGPAWPLRGGLASFDERLAREFKLQGYESMIYTFSLQYPDFLFPGTTQYSTEPAPADLSIKVCINSINPLNWLRVGKELAQLKPDLIIVRYWLPLMGPCLGTILRKVRKNGFTRVICIADNVIPHEHRPGDTAFTKYFVRPIHAFITMSEKVKEDLRLFTNKPARQVVHPLYDNFGEAMDKREARAHLSLPADGKIILFFGFIRKYKGLDLLLEAMQDARIQAAGIKLLVAGEFYEKKEEYDALIEKLGISAQLILRTDFIADSEVRYFEKPMLVTNVGGLPDLVPDGKVGIVTEPAPTAIAEGIQRLYELGEDYFLPHLREEKKKYSWHQLAMAIEEMAKESA
jgi:glycosyltransferase involved in cell wall biosynthesis